MKDGDGFCEKGGSFFTFGHPPGMPMRVGGIGLKFTELKLEIFIPASYLPGLRSALQSVHAGVLGNYDSCLAYSNVTGSWRPLPGSHPYLGTEGEVTEETEIKVEVNILAENLEKTLDAVHKVHPYEEPLVNVIPLLNRKKEQIMSKIFVCYPRCTTCQKAETWLADHGIAVKVRDIKGENPTEQELRSWHKISGLPLKRFFNTSGQKYREMGLKDKLATMSEDEQYALLSTDGMLVKRPILVSDDFVLVGFKEQEWQKALR